jgi:hypothetical protein
MEFEIQPSGLLRYANNSNYKNAKMIRKQGGSIAFECSVDNQPPFDRSKTIPPPHLTTGHHQ